MIIMQYTDHPDCLILSRTWCRLAQNWYFSVQSVLCKREIKKQLLSYSFKICQKLENEKQILTFEISR